MQTLQFSHKTQSKKLHIPSLSLALVLLISLAPPTSSCTEHEKTSLRRFLAGLSRDNGLATTWLSNKDCCNWEGIICSSPNRTVTDVSLASRGLEGTISPFLGNLTSLLRLNLSHNSLSGGLPLELVSSSSITILDVSFNQLKGTLHKLASPTPARPLQVLNISSNLFAGQFPSTTWEAMENLRALNASNNSFTGHIPTYFCISSPSFAVLDLCLNKLSGKIPQQIGHCSKLRELRAGYNNISGEIPDELFNATLLEYLSFRNNHLNGVLDGVHITKLRNLVALDLGGNNFSGKIPDSIGQLKKLEEFHLDNNNLSGELPSALSNCTNLVAIDLKKNNFSGQLGKVNFSNLPNLKTLDVYFNNFTGTVPESIYSCINLTALRLAENNFSGQLSPRMGKLKYLTFISITNNHFNNITNTLHILKNCRNLTTLLMAVNFREEIMPEDDKIDGFVNLQVLGISGCYLTGNIPVWISSLANLELLDLHQNKLNGSIPAWIETLSKLFYLDISNNRLTGRIPTALMNMPMLMSGTETQLDPSVFELPVYTDPSLQYRIPIAFPKVLDLSNNTFTGEIPLEIGHLKALFSLNFSFNALTGWIPQTVCNLTNLQVLDLSNNDLTAPTPLISKKHRDKKDTLPITFGVFFGGIAVLLLLGRLLVLIRMKSLTIKNGRGSNGDVEATSIHSSSEQTLVVMWMPQGKEEENKLKFTDILKATNNFDKENIIGCGGYGLVYKAELPDGTKLAIKKLSGEMWLMEREFNAEVDALSMAQHENLVPLWGYCVHGNSRLLIYSYMENGSLDDWLHNRDDDASSFLHWPTRLKIAQGASLGLSYIHDVCKPQIVHRDIKSSNILLDKEFKAYVADFGLARLILPNKTHVTTELVGTMGYIPPEYGQAWVATLRGDIYSFGVVLLELLTGRRPIPVLSTSKELVPWVLHMRSEGKQTEVFDPTLQGAGYEEQMLKVLETACKCVDNNQVRRPDITEVVSCLASIEAVSHVG
ncbi:unnamed protein product [Triticum turgidum subsp. durum]|uniref:non-specific serine/threonine protein kinase n=1 Tax=Triticum turgidum subsp. durum TaxID=4567 RepID=A0A9R0YIS4_TRITD|nr:unnamed protein product [Triticum turgidum subsp. durum]